MKFGLRLFVVGFVVGMLVGGAVVRLQGGKPGRTQMSGEKRQERMLERLTSELRLDPDQRQAIAGILKEGRVKMDEVMAPVRPRFEKVRRETNARIREKLTPEQLPKFDALNKRMEKRWRERHGRVPSSPDNAPVR